MYGMKKEKKYENKKSKHKTNTWMIR